MSHLQKRPVCLAIAGSDSCGGAGIQTDLRTFHALDVYGTSVITAVTSQTPSQVRDIYPLPQSVIASQLDAALQTADPACIKIGMVYSDETLNTLADILEKTTCPVVMDPVLTAGSGDSLNERLSRDVILKFIKERVSILTPNIPEAEYLLDRPIDFSSNCLDPAGELKELCCSDVYLKGGHDHKPEKRSADCLISDVGGYILNAPPLDPVASHGTGCTLSSALAAQLALGQPLIDAAIAAKAFVWQSLNNGISLSSDYSAMVPPGKLDVSMITCKPVAFQGSPQV